MFVYAFLNHRLTRTVFDILWSQSCDFNELTSTGFYNKCVSAKPYINLNDNGEHFEVFQASR